MKKYLLLVSAFLFAVACKEDQPKPEYPNPWPKHYAAPVIPEDNQLTEARVELGRKLFFDVILSRDLTVSCSGCHKHDFAMADNVPISPGVQGRLGKRNAPSLLDAAYLTHLNWDGGTQSLETQVLVPLQAHVEMDMTFDEMIARLKAKPEYRKMFRDAYDREPDAFGITRALAAFQRTLYSGTSAYDRFLQGDSLALSESAKRGRDLFFGEKMECFHCHSGNFLTDHTFQNNGLYEVYADSGRFNITGKERDMAKFKTPGLRNIARTAPYMHDGSLPTLDAVLDHYQTGGKAHPNKSPLLRPFTLSPQERADVLAFFNSLNDE